VLHIDPNDEKARNNLQIALKLMTTMNPASR
jgi:hypothetical protein